MTERFAASPRIVPCEACGTEGRVYVLDYGYDRETGNYWGERDDGPCPYCEGTGGETVETDEIDEGDFDAAFGPTCKYPDCDGGPATGYCHVSCREQRSDGESGTKEDKR